TKETPDTQAPTQPGALAFSNVEETSVSVAWTASTDNKAVTGYEVSVNGVLKTTVSTPTVNLTGLTANTEYSISVVAIDAAGNKSTARTGTVTTKTSPDTESPTTPGNVAVSDLNNNEYTVTWTASTDNEGVAGYEVWIDGSLYQTVTNGTGITVPALWATDESKTITVSVRAVDNSGNRSAHSSEVQKTFDAQNPTLTQTISLQAGWNLISIYVVPDNAAVEAIFAAILPQIDIVKNEDGFYKPGVAAPLQSLIELKAGYGYLVQAKSAVTLSIQGKVAKNVSVALKPGWNMIGYPFAQAKATTATLSSVWANAREIKNFDGFLTKTSGTLNTMNAGKGYYIYVESVGVLSF
ncbi:MAG: fibronectin type III domain-containing protein, partial [Bacteroidales bacterium]|nr:fibronectin type III domain-containing protein [Bacteroidales bacterium]